MKYYYLYEKRLDNKYCSRISCFSSLVKYLPNYKISYYPIYLLMFLHKLALYDSLIIKDYKILNNKIIDDLNKELFHLVINGIEINTPVESDKLRYNGLPPNYCFVNNILTKEEFDMVDNVFSKYKEDIDYEIIDFAFYFQEEQAAQEFINYIRTIYQAYGEFIVMVQEV